MDFKQKKDCLRQVDFLSVLPDSTLESLARDCRVISLKSRDVLFREEDLGESMFVILTGELMVTKSGRDIAIRGPGQYVGEMSLLQIVPRSATVIGRQETRILEITREQFLAYFASNSQSLLSLLHNFSDRSRTDLDVLVRDFKQLQFQKAEVTLFRRILENSPHEFYLLDGKNFRFTRANKRACDNLGYSEVELCGLTPMDIIQDFSPDRLRDVIRPLAGENNSWVGFDGQGKRKDDTLYPIRARFEVVEVGRESALALVVEDKTEQLQVEEEIHSKTFYDSLTGFPNRDLLLDRLVLAVNRSQRRGETGAILFLDMDNFKTINNSLGHRIGDLLLQEVAKKLTDCLRQEDTLARIGGDEFAALLSSIRNEKDSALVAGKILKDLEKPFVIDTHEIYVTFSMGIAVFPVDGSEPSTLLKHAEVAMYRAKEKGKNTFEHYNPSLLLKATEQMLLEGGLRRALARDEFRLHYQPRVDLQTGRIVGLEALIRWEHPDSGLVPPGRFIPVAEESRLIIPIGEWVLAAACRQIKAWDALGLPPLVVAVNLSGHQFAQEKLVPWVKSTLESMGLAPQRLELEITESILLESSDAAIDKLKQLHEYGIELSIDDFGTGYSSLMYLRRLPVDTLKVDQSFVRDLADEANAQITRMIVTLAHTLKKKTVAEGVETQAQKDFLISIGCDHMQGYLFSKPLPPKEITALLTDHFRT
jgi:diguanylate cyclase (GGDEF)-like protein/PAS domain S-box-containing protein